MTDDARRIERIEKQVAELTKRQAEHDRLLFFVPPGEDKPMWDRVAVVVISAERTSWMMRGAIRLAGAIFATAIFLGSVIGIVTWWRQ